MSNPKLGVSEEAWRSTLATDELEQLAALETAAAATKVAYEALMKRRSVLQRRAQSRLAHRTKRGKKG